jgi:hypothetical protein
MLAPLFSAAYLVINRIGTLIESGDARGKYGSATLPPNLMLTARRPLDD